MKPLLAVTDIVKSYAHRQSNQPVLNALTFNIGAGEAVGLLGPSGGGKTTLARLIAGLDVPDSGTIAWPALNETASPKVQMVFQNPYGSLYHGMTVRDIVLEPLILQQPGLGQAERRLALSAVLEKVRLPGDRQFLDRYPRQLSGGQRQRVAIARALIGGPQLIIADEPTSMLDVTAQSGILEVLAELNRQCNLSILLITHNLAVAASVCRRLMVLYDGRIVENNAAGIIIRQPRHCYTQLLVQTVYANSSLLAPAADSSSSAAN